MPQFSTAVALLGAAAFAILFRTPKQYLLHTMVVGFISATGLTMRPLEANVGVWTFFVALIVAMVSHIMARATRVPAQSFLIPGIIILVPGSYIYRAFGNALEEDMQGAMRQGLTAIVIACAISFALLLANWIIPSKKTL